MSVFTRTPLGRRQISVAAGAAGESDEIDIGQASSVGLIMPSDWVTSNITFKVSDVAGGTYIDLYLNGIKFYLPSLQANRAYALPLDRVLLSCWQFMKIVSVVDQTTAKSVIVVAKA